MYSVHDFSSVLCLWNLLLWLCIGEPETSGDEDGAKDQKKKQQRKGDGKASDNEGIPPVNLAS